MEARTLAVEAAMSDIRDIEGTLGVTRQGVSAVRDRLIELASNTELFPADDFRMPEAGTDSVMYRIAEGDDGRFALYLQASTGREPTPVHNHGTWASVVGFEGQELNRFYDRSDDGVKETHSSMVEAGAGVAMLPDDLHSIRIDGEARVFHCYGLALEKLPNPEYFSESDRTWKNFERATSIREAR